MAMAKEMVSASRMYGTGLNTSALASRIINEAGGSRLRVKTLRNEVQQYINSTESRQLDQLLSDMGWYEIALPAAPSIPTLVFRVPVTPSDAGALQFPPADAPLSVKQAFYTSQAYYDYMMRRAQQTAPYSGGRDAIFDSYVLGNVLSYQGQANILNAKSYLANIAQFERDEIAARVRTGARTNGFEFTANEAAVLASGGIVSIAQRSDGVFVSIDQYLFPNDILVNAPTAVPPLGVVSPGIATMTLGGVSFLPLFQNASASSEDRYSERYRDLSVDEKQVLRRVFTSISDANVLLHFGTDPARMPFLARKAFESGAGAITLGNHIYFFSQPRNMSFGNDLLLLVHEMMHVVQYRQFGMLEVFRRIALQAATCGSNNAYQYIRFEPNFSVLPLESRAELAQHYAGYQLYGILPSMVVDGVVVNVTAAQLEQYAVGSGLFGK